MPRIYRPWRARSKQDRHSVVFGLSYTGSPNRTGRAYPCIESFILQGTSITSYLYATWPIEWTIARAAHVYDVLLAATFLGRSSDMESRNIWIPQPIFSYSIKETVSFQMYITLALNAQGYRYVLYHLLHHPMHGTQFWWHRVFMCLRVISRINSDYLPI